MPELWGNHRIPPAQSPPRGSILPFLPGTKGKKGLGPFFREAKSLFFQGLGPFSQLLKAAAFLGNLTFGRIQALARLASGKECPIFRRLFAGSDALALFLVTTSVHRGAFRQP